MAVEKTTEKIIKQDTSSNPSNFSDLFTEMLSKHFKVFLFLNVLKFFLLEPYDDFLKRNVRSLFLKKRIFKARHVSKHKCSIYLLESNRRERMSNQPTFFQDPVLLFPLWEQSTDKCRKCSQTKVYERFRTCSYNQYL